MKWINWLLTPARKPEFENVNYEARGGQCTTPLPTAIRPPVPPCPPMKPDWPMVAPEPYFVISFDKNNKLGVEYITTFKTRMDRSRFVTNDNGRPIHFKTRKRALAYLNENFRADVIRTEDYTGPIS